MPSGTNVNLCVISVALKMIEKITTALESSKECDPEYVPVVVLKNIELELS